MEKTRSATYQAMLDHAGITSDDSLWAKPSNDETAEQRRIRQRLAVAFDDLASAERRLTAALAAFNGEVEREQKHLTEGLRVDTGWIEQSARQAGEADAAMKAAIERITLLTWLANGSKPKS